uniref:EB domain-containing protein n=1 Tax=Globodera pallida TaxID=36090 RepID=A0A183C1J3_GLOPA
MKTVIALVAFLTIFVPLNSAIGGPLKCKRGSAISLEGTDRSEISNCSTPSDEYCIEATCTAWDQPGNLNKFWDCVVSKEAGECAFYKQTMEERTKSKNVSCDCRYGEKGKPSFAATNSRVRCKAGTIKASGEGRTYYSDCLDEYAYCYEAYCAKAKCYQKKQTQFIGIGYGDQPGNLNKFWDCVVSKEAGECAFYKQTMEERTKSKNVSCDCRYGEKGKPSSAATNSRLQCKAGTVKASGEGRTYYSDCLDGYAYCYEAYCAKAKWNEHVQTMWGCSKDTNSSSCNAVSVAVSAKIDAAVKCKCTFGAKGVQNRNKHFPISPTMPMTTTAEENRSARRSFAIFWTLLVAIGILA